jgi:uncharacterized protein
MRSTHRRVVVALALAGLLAACAGSPDYYLLPPPQSAATRLPSPVSSIVVADIDLPTYAEALEVAVLTGPLALRLDSAVSWADNPRRAMTRHLTEALEARLATRVAADPWPGFDQPGLRVEVRVDRLVGAPEAGLTFSGQYFIVAPDSGTVTAVERFSYNVPVTGEGVAGLAAAHAAAIDLLADDIAARIAGRARASS